MPPTSKSLIKVNFIKNDPVEKIPNNKLFIKGKEQNIDIILDGKRTTLDRHTLIQMLKELKLKSNEKISNLDKNYKEYLTNIIELINILKPTEYHSIVINDIKSVFSDVKDVNVGTVASYFTFTTNNSRMKNNECNPQNVLSLVNPGKSCSDSSLIYSNNIFHFLVNKKTPHAYIYIMNQVFNGFTDINIKELKDENITNVTIIVGDNKDGYTNYNNNTALNNLPKIVSQTKSSMVASTSSSSTMNANTAVIVVFVVIALIILIILFIMFAKSYYRDSFK